MNTATSKQVKRFYEFGRFRLDVANRLLLKDGEIVTLKRKAVETLIILVERGGAVVSKDELIQTLWPDSFVEESNLSQYIYLLRKTLGEGEYIQTLSGRGYRFTAEVRETTGAPDTKSWSESDTLAELELPAEPFGAPATDGPVSAPMELAESKLLAAQRKRRNWALILAAPALAAVTVGIGLWGKFAAPKPPAPEPRLRPATSFAGNEAEPAFSPDGKQLAFIWDGEKGNNPDVYVKLLDVGAPLRLTTDPAVEHCPVWSPDGRYIVFLRETNGATRKLMIVPALGGPERFLGEFQSGLDWSPDGRTIAVVEQGAIHLLNIETGQRQRLTAPPSQTLGDVLPVFSPDGKKLAFVRAEGGPGKIFMVAASGGEPREVIFEKSRLHTLRWMPDSSHLLYVANRAGSYQLWRVSEFGGAPERVTSVGNDIGDLAVSRTGTLLAFSQSASDINIWRFALAGATAVTKPDGAAPERWAPLIASSRVDHSPQYAPDGQRIVFASNRSGNEELWVCASDGSNARQVTQMRGPATGSPRWSPDGRELVFGSNLYAQADIFVISAESGQPRRLTDHPALDVTPSWSRDGQWIYFSSTRSGARQIWKLPAKGGEPIQVTRHGGFDSYESADGKYLYYTKQREVAGIWRLPLVGGDEELVPGTKGVKEHRAWTGAAQGIYFAVSTDANLHWLKFYSFATGRVAEVTSLPKQPVYGPPGLAVSPDGLSILYVQRDSSSSDIMLVENFR
jgi:Tol biopolymer transport system component/DNA-binding winged helix-turn-helix (wHTH) protein